MTDATTARTATDVTTDWRVKKIYDMMADPTVSPSAIKEEFCDILSRWKLIEGSHRYALGFIRTGDNWRSLSDCLDDELSQAEYEKAFDAPFSPVYVRVYAKETGFWCFSKTDHATNRTTELAMLKINCPIILHLTDHKLTASDDELITVVPYDESMIDQNLQKIVDSCEPYRQRGLFADGFGAVWMKMTADLADWGEMTRNQGLLAELKVIMDQAI